MGPMCTGLGLLCIISISRSSFRSFTYFSYTLFVCSLCTPALIIGFICNLLSCLSVILGRVLEHFFRDLRVYFSLIKCTKCHCTYISCSQIRFSSISSTPVVWALWFMLQRIKNIIYYLFSSSLLFIVHI